MDLSNDIIIVGYSFKGGSGRTTSAVNIAGGLLTRGKKVVCIDMDFGSPGMRTILYRSFFRKIFENYVKGEDTVVPFEDENLFSKIGIHEFLDGKVSNPDDFVRENCFDFWKHRTDNSESDEPRDIEKRKDRQLHLYFSEYFQVYYNPKKFWSGELLFIPGSLHERSVSILRHETHRKFRARFDSLKNSIRQYFHKRDPEMKEGETIYYILDSASGVNENSLPVLRMADMLIIFFRWSLQHVYGTKENIRILNIFLDDSKALGMRMFLVGNCAPHENLIKKFLEKNAHHQFQRIAAWYKKEKKILRHESFENPNDYIYIDDIYDEALLRFSESYVFMDPMREEQGPSALGKIEIDIHHTNIKKFYKVSKTITDTGAEIQEGRRNLMRWRESL